jgi:hypothetical protein
VQGGSTDAPKFTYTLGVSEFAVCEFGKKVGKKEFGMGSAATNATESFLAGVVCV